MSDVSLKATVTFAPRGSAGQFIQTRVTPGVIASVKAAQGLAVQEAKSLCPVRTGALRDSIQAVEPEETGKTVVGLVVASAPYSGYVEYGVGIRGSSGPNPGPYPYSSSVQGFEARPFLRPALDTARDAIKEIFSSNLAVALRV